MINLSHFSIRERRMLIGTLFAAFFLHVSLSFIQPLSADEAHYALYALHLDWSYLDHPPLVGWLQALILPFDSNDWALRFIPNILHLMTSIGLIALCNALYGGKAMIALGSVILYQLSVIFQILGLGMTPETPLLALGVWSCVFALYICRHATLKNWIILGVLLGFMGLSKYTALMFAIGLGIYFISQKMIWWRDYRFFIAMTIAVLMIMPVLYWNFNNEFISFNYQWGHGNINAKGFHLNSFLNAQAFQALLYTPVLFIACWVFSIQGLWKKDKLFLACINLPTLLLFAWSSTKGGHYLPHWTALPLLISIPFVSKWISESWQNNKRFIAWSHLIVSGSLLIIFVLLITGWLPKSINQVALKDLRGWKEIALVAKQLVIKLPKNQQNIYIDNRWNASRIAWYARPIPLVLLDKRPSQYQLWAEPFANTEGGIVVTNDDSSTSDIARIYSHFDKCVLVETRSFDSQEGISRFQLHYCQK